MEPDFDALFARAHVRPLPPREPLPLSRIGHRIAVASVIGALLFVAWHAPSTWGEASRIAAEGQP